MYMYEVKEILYLLKLFLITGLVACPGMVLIKKNEIAKKTAKENIERDRVNKERKLKEEFLQSQIYVNNSILEKIKTR